MRPAQSREPASRPRRDGPRWAIPKAAARRAGLLVKAEAMTPSTQTLQPSTGLTPPPGPQRQPHHDDQKTDVRSCHIRPPPHAHPPRRVTRQGQLDHGKWAWVKSGSGLREQLWESCDAPPTPRSIRRSSSESPGRSDHAVLDHLRGREQVRVRPRWAGRQRCRDEPDTRLERSSTPVRSGQSWTPTTTTANADDCGHRPPVAHSPTPTVVNGRLVQRNR